MDVNPVVAGSLDSPLEPSSSLPLLSIGESRRLLAWILVLVAAADLLLWKEKFGLGVSLFGLVCGAALIANRHRRSLDAAWLLGATLALASLIQSAVFSSDYNRLVLAGLFSVAMVDGDLRQASSRGAGPGIALHAWFHCLGRFATFLRNLRLMEASQTPHARVARLLTILFPSLLLLALFLFLLGQGNAVLAHSLNALGSQISDWLRRVNFPSPVRIAFWVAASVAAVSFVWPTPAGAVLGALTTPWSRFEAPKEVEISRWRTIAILIALNVAYLANNLLDLRYLWMGDGLPQGVTFSGYVHEGTNWLIAAAVIAGGVITFLFQQDRTVTTKAGLRGLALLWIAQNIAMAGGVLLRLKLYVDAYDLTLARIGVACFVLLVVAGFGLLAWKVLFHKSLNWLVLGNALAVFALFFALQFMDLPGFTARHNTRQWLDNPRAKIDLDYLARLGPAAWPSLKEIAESGRQGNFPRLARSELAKAEGRLEPDPSWQSWTWQDSTLQKEVFSK